MNVVNTDTGEPVELLDRAEAERLTTRIRLRLDTIADNYVAVMPLIREAIERQAYAALGYTGVSQYVSECFGDALAHLGVEVRREVVRELTAAGMSTRAIAPVVGVSQMQVSRDVRAGETSVTPEPNPLVALPDGKVTVAEIVEKADKYAKRFEDYEPKPEDERAPVVGIDGKTYTRPEPRRRPLPDQARTAGWDLQKAVERIQRIAADDRFAANKDQMAPHLRSHLTNAIEVCQDLLDRIND